MADYEAVEYEAPALTELGSLSELTKANIFIGVGSLLDVFIHLGI